MTRLDRDQGESDWLFLAHQDSESRNNQSEISVELCHQYGTFGVQSLRGLEIHKEGNLLF